MAHASTLGRSPHGPGPIGHLPTFILGVPDHFRGVELLARLADIGLEPHHIPAVDGRALSPDGLSKIYDAASARYIERELTPAEAACAFGHLTMMRAFLKAGGEWGLFLEDDAQLLGDLAPLVGLLEQRLPSPTVVHLECGSSPSACGVRLAENAGTRIVAIDSAPLRTVGYLANRATARLAVEAYADHRVDSVADWPVRWRYDVQFAACVPPLVGHEDSDSSIEADRVLAQSAGLRTRPERVARVLTCLSPRSRARGRGHGYSTSLVLRHQVIPLAWAVRNRWRHLASRGAALG